MTGHAETEIGEGEPAPDFTAPTDEGTNLSLRELRGRKVVIFFYPRDDTPGCTIESCEFRDAHPAFVARDAVVLGISPDSVASHEKFKRKFNLPFTLVADQGHSIAERYGVWKQKSTFGVKHMGVERTTFLVDREGRIARIFRKVRPQGHAAEVEEALRAIA